MRQHRNVLRQNANNVLAGIMEVSVRANRVVKVVIMTQELGGVEQDRDQTIRFGEVVPRSVTTCLVSMTDLTWMLANT